MKKLIIIMLYLYGSGSFAINNRDIPHVFVDPQGNVMNYADLFRADVEVVIRYYFDPSINRLAVQDGQNSFALDAIIRTELREGLFQWVDATRSEFRIEEVDSADRANFIIYGLMNWDLPMDPPPMMSFPPNMPRPITLPGARDVATIYVVNSGIQRQLNNFLDSGQDFSRQFRTYTGIDNVQNYLTFTTFLTLIHESGHAFGLAHPGGERGVMGGYTIRPIAQRIPSSIALGTQIMLADILEYLEGRYRQLVRPVQREDIAISTQESWLMRYLWSQRNRVLHCLPTAWPTSMVSVLSPSRGCVNSLPRADILPWFLLL